MFKASIAFKGFTIFECSGVDLNPVIGYRAVSDGVVILLFLLTIANTSFLTPALTLLFLFL